MSGQNTLTKVKLEEAKKSVKLFGLDYDGTITDGADYKIGEAMELIEKILINDKAVAFITARAVTAIKTFIPPLKEILAKNKINVPVFIGGGNGTTLYEVKPNDELVKVYSHGLTVSEISFAISAWQKVYNDFVLSVEDLSVKGLDTFHKFLKDDWKDLIPNEIYQLCLPFDGKIFTEEAKFTFVLPSDQSIHQELVVAVRKELGDNYQIAAGDAHFAHVTKALQEDGKAVAIKTILKIMNLDSNQVVTFGDMPTGNDKGLLSFPYSFTNSDEFANIKNNNSEPPYILFDLNLSPVARVYDAISCLMS